MSSPARRVRQPGRTALGAYPRQCQICNNALGGIGSINLALRNFGTCSFFNGDGGAYLNIPLNAGQCDELVLGGAAPSCNWGLSFVTGGHTIQITVTARCVAGVPSFEISINDVTDAVVIVQGSWDASPSVCGELDCTGLGSSGWLPFTTINSSGLCGNPDQVGSPEYMVTFHAGENCPQDAHRNCCCGGAPAHPCAACCGDGGKTAWDVDLSGVTLVAGAPGGDGGGGCFTVDGFIGCWDDVGNCPSFPGIYTLANSNGSACAWKYYFKACGPYFILISLLATGPDESGNCAWNLTIEDNGCAGAASYHADVPAGSCSQPITLTAIGHTGYFTPGMVCGLAFPDTIVISPS